MIILLSPAKSLDFSPIHQNGVSEPRLLSDTGILAKILSTKSANKLKKLMDISTAIAEENVTRNKTFQLNHTKENSKPAVLAFNGDVYRGLDNGTLSSDDLQFAQVHLRIISGLYGLLRPMDLIQPYRLEMGTSLNNRRGKNLYKFWGNRITKLVNEDLQNSGSKLVVNLASKEYFAAINKTKLEGDLLTINFKEYRDEELKFISFDAKRARGFMTRYIIDNRITDRENIKSFNMENYSFSTEHSTDDNWLFIR